MTGIKLWKRPQPGGARSDSGSWQLAKSSSIPTNQPMMHPLIILWSPLSKLHQPISSAAGDFLHPNFGRRGVQGWSIGSVGGINLWESIPCRPGRPRGADTSAKTNDSSWWNIIIRCSYTALPRWNIIIVRVKNDPGATGALMELLPHRWSTNTRGSTLDILDKLFTSWN